MTFNTTTNIPLRRRRSLRAKPPIDPLFDDALRDILEREHGQPRKHTPGQRAEICRLCLAYVPEPGA